MAVARGERGPQKPESKSFRAWKGLDLTSSRLSLPDDALHWCDNAMLVGDELQALPIYNGALGAVLHASTPKNSLPCYLTYGAFTQPHPVAIVVYVDGAAYQRDLFNDGAVDVQIAPPGTFHAAAITAMTMWRDGPVLFLDQLAGYCKWDGVTFTVIDATKKGYGLAVFEGHAWLVTGPRTITFTAPDTFDDFTGANGAGAFRITDEAFEGQVFVVHSSVQQLWILGQSAIDALGSVQTVGGITTFAVTNAVGSIGTTFGPGGVTSHFRTLVFPTGASIHGLLGVTPQPLSAKIDRLFARLAPAITFGPSAGDVELNGRTVLAYLYDFDDPTIGQHRSLLLCYESGRWFLASPPTIAGHRILDILSLLIHRTPELYGIDEAGHLHRVFARVGDDKGGRTGIFFKLFDFGQPLQAHTAIKLGLDVVAPADVAQATVTIELVNEKAVLFLPVVNEPCLPVADSPLGLRYALIRRGVKTGFTGQRIGVTIGFNSADRLAIAGLHLQVDPGDEWD